MASIGKKPNTNVRQMANWHEGHTELFKRAHAETGQVVTARCWWHGQDAGAGRTDQCKTTTPKSKWKTTYEGLAKAGRKFEDYTWPNIWTYHMVAGVGYYPEHDLSKEVTDILQLNPVSRCVKKVN